MPHRDEDRPCDQGCVEPSRRGGSEEGPTSRGGVAAARWAGVLTSTEHRTLRQVLLVLFSSADAVSKAFSWGSGAMALLYLTPSVVAVAAVVVRRRWPLVALLVSLPSLFFSGLQIAPTILLANHTYRRRTFPVALISAVTLGLTVAGSIVFWYPGQEWALVNLQSGIYFAGFIGGASLLGQLLKVRGEQRDQLVALQLSRHREHLLVEAAARADEREHLAREMHDVVSHQVSLIAVQAGALRVTGGLPVTVTETAETIRTLAVRANDELRQVLGALRSEDVAASLDAQHTVADIAHLWGATEVRGRLELPAVDELATVPAPVQRAVHRIAQEALTNVCRHAHGAVVDLSVTVSEDPRPEGREGPEVVLVVVNGAPPPTVPVPAGERLVGGSGLVGAGERARSLGGTLTAGPVAGGGFVVTARLPLRRSARRGTVGGAAVGGPPA